MISTQYRSTYLQNYWENPTSKDKLKLYQKQGEVRGKMQFSSNNIP